MQSYPEFTQSYPEFTQPYPEFTQSYLESTQHRLDSVKNISDQLLIDQVRKFEYFRTRINDFQEVVELHREGSLHIFTPVQLELFKF